MTSNIDETYPRLLRSNRLLLAAFALATAFALVACDDDDDDFVCLSDEECSGVCVDGTCEDDNQDASDDGDSGGTDTTDTDDGGATAVCGDASCDGGETADSCYEDCGSCGDSVCTDGEETLTSCAEDCAVCGDDICTASQEDATSCVDDCANCGDATCDSDETIASCYQDCGRCGDDICTDGEEDDVSCYEDCGECGDFICQTAEAPGSADACPADCDVTGYRITEASIAGPTFVLIADGACNPLNGLVDLLLNGALAEPDEGEAYGLSIIQLFRPFGLDAPAGTRSDIGPAECSPTETGGPTCDVLVEDDSTEIALAMTTYSAAATGSCNDPLPGTPPAGVTPPSAPCYGTGETELDLTISGIRIPLKATQATATFDAGDPAAGLSNGVVTGFVTLTDARGILLPEELALIAPDVTNLAELLPGPDSCQVVAEADMAKGPGGNPGWWFYLTFASDQPIEWQGE